MEGNVHCCRLRDLMRLRLPAGFAARLAVATSVLVVVVCIAQSWLLARHDLDHVRGYLADRGRSVAEQVAREAAHALAQGDVDGVQRLVDQARAASGGVYARVLDRQGLLVDAGYRISRGDFASRVAAGNCDEVGRLAGSFNAMAESLARSRAALEEKVRELERANHLKSEFLATVSHELRTPLNVILGYTEMLAEGAGGTVTPAQAEMIGTIDRYSRNQLELITSVLDFTRLSSGKASLSVERFALAPL